MWQRKGDLFPHLQFCDSVEKQLQILQTNNPMLRSVEGRLLELESASKVWTSGAFDLNTVPSKATPESQSRLQRLKTDLTFHCPDGNSHLFSLHLRMTPGAWRLYFLVELGPEEKIIIGYIGPKLQ